MILTCPSCATSYFAPDEAIGPTGRTVRCKSCQHSWKATLDTPLELADTTASLTAPVEAVPGPIEQAEPVGDEATDGPSDSLADTPAPELPQAYRAREDQKRRLRRAAVHGVVWAGIAAGFVGLIGAATLFRVEVVDLMPRAASAYAAVGLHVNPTGLEFEAVSARPLPNDPSRIVISGALRNVRDDEREAPPVRVALLDASGAEIAHAVAPMDGPPVLPGKTQGFAAIVFDPGAKGMGVDVDFVADSGGQDTPAAASHGAARPDHASPAHVATPARPLPRPDGPVLRGMLAPDTAPAPTMTPIDAAPVKPAETALDSHAAEAVSAPHG